LVALPSAALKLTLASSSASVALMPASSVAAASLGQ
jgi:hypothetical protein